MTLRQRLADAHAALTLPGWTETIPLAGTRQWVTPTGPLVSVVALLLDRSIRISTSIDGRIEYVTVTAPGLVQPVLEAVAREVRS